LSAISAKIFGLNEFAIRFPSVIFGVLAIWVVYLLGKELFNRNIGLLAAFFITFSKLEILWSRQARPYQALQFFFLLSAWFIYKLAKEKKFNWRYFIGFLGSGVLASLMHGLGLVIFFVGFIYLIITKFSMFRKKWIWLGIALFSFFGWIFKISLISVFSQFGKINNLFYYRVFLTHNYLVFCLLAVLGGFLLIRRKSYQELFLFVIFLGVQIIICSFFLGQPFTRYFYIVFPFLILLSAVGLESISQALSSRVNKLQTLNTEHLTLVILAIFIIAMGNKFTLFPQRVYSLNEDMQEVPEVDWKKIYGFVDEKLKENPDAVLITNWSDLPVWYLGEGKPDFLVRKDVGTEKDIFSKAIILSDLYSFQELVKTKEKGIIIIDSWDNYIPDGISEYARENLKKELEVDRIYSIQPRYWPVEVYSWGLD